MLHKIELPAYVDQLKRILDFQQHLLAFACNPTTTFPLDKAHILASFGDEAGKWLIERLMTSKERLWTFGEELRDVILYVQAHRSEGPEIVKAFANDRQFYRKLDDVSFEFKYKKLDEGTRKVLAPLMVSFYEKLLKAGFPSYIHGGQAKLLKRSQLLQEFRAANPRLKVCPGCDGQRTRSGDDNEEEDEENDLSDIDHFFPKSLYPFFAIHPINLVPLCTDCNTKVKKQKDPLDTNDHGKDVLSRTFLPFVNPAAPNIEVCVSSNGNGKHIISIHDKEQPNSQRVRNLDRVFKLRKYWERRLKRQLELMQYQLSEARAQAKAAGRQIDKEIVKQKLCEWLYDYGNNVGSVEWLLVLASYSRFALHDTNELDALVAIVMER